jgi:hypothetical protein
LIWLWCPSWRRSLLLLSRFVSRYLKEMKKNAASQEVENTWSGFVLSKNKIYFVDYNRLKIPNFLTLAPELREAQLHGSVLLDSAVVPDPTGRCHCSRWVQFKKKTFS